MAVKLDALIAKTEAAIATEQDAKKRVRLAAQLAQYNATRVAMESDHEEPDGDEDGDDDEDDDSAAARAAKTAERKAKMAEAAKHRANAAKHRAKAAEYEDAARKCESEDDEEEDDEDAASLPHVERGASAAAIEDHATAQQNRRIARLETTIAEKDKAASIASALASGQITPALAKKLAGKSATWVAEYLDTTKEMRMANTSEGALLVPRDGHSLAPAPDAAALAEIDARIARIGLTDAAQIAKLRADMIANRANALNGAGRY